MWCSTTRTRTSRIRLPITDESSTRRLAKAPSAEISLCVSARKRRVQASDNEDIGPGPPEEPHRGFQVLPGFAGQSDHDIGEDAEARLAHQAHRPPVHVGRGAFAQSVE